MLNTNLLLFIFSPIIKKNFIVESFNILTLDFEDILEDPNLTITIHGFFN
jgi:hypothetical protein